MTTERTTETYRIERASLRRGSSTSLPLDLDDLQTFLLAASDIAGDTPVTVQVGQHGDGSLYLWGIECERKIVNSE